jgi:hypothetical protein
MNPRWNVEPCSPFDPGGPVVQIYRRLEAGQLIKAGLAQGEIYDFAVHLDLKAQTFFVEHPSAISAAGVALQGFLAQSKLHHWVSSFGNRFQVSDGKFSVKGRSK